MMNEPIAVSPKTAFFSIGVGNTKGYELIKSGQLDAIKLGRSTRILWESVKRVVESAPRVLPTL